MTALSNHEIGEMMAARAKGAPDWLAFLRAEGEAAFRRAGLPTRRVEAWKYSDLARTLAEAAPIDAERLPPIALPDACRATFRNGALDETRLTVPGATPLRRLLAEPSAPAMFGAHLLGDHPLVSLNTALMEDGLVLRVPRNTVIDKPIHLNFVWDSAPDRDGAHLRLLIVLDDNAEAAIIETHEGNPGFVSVVTEIRLGQGARLAHTRLERLGAGARQSAVTAGEIGRRASYRGFYLSCGAQFARHEALLTLAGEGAEAVIDGAYLVAQSRHCDNTTVLTHAAPRTLSRQTFRGVMTGHGRGVYQGCVRVRPDAQGTDAQQLSRALLLSHHAEIATKPELEILADDVKCSHGASAGELDAAALFFLRARGIPEREARALLVEAFLSEALDAIPAEGLRDLASGILRDWLAAHAHEVSHVE